MFLDTMLLDTKDTKGSNCNGGASLKGAHVLALCLKFRKRLINGLDAWVELRVQLQRPRAMAVAIYLGTGSHGTGGAGDS